MKVIEILKKLSKVERNRLKKFLESPYLNSNVEILEIYLVIDELLRKEGDIQKKDVWKKSFKKAPFNDLKWRKYMTSLIALIEKFMAFEMILEDEISFSNNSMRLALDKGIQEIAEFSTKSIERKSGLAPSFSFRSIINRIIYLKNREDLKTDFEKKQLSEKSDLLTEDLLKLDSLLDQLYVQEKLRIACAFDNFNHALNINDKISFEEEVIKIAESLKNEGYKGVDIYLKTLFFYRTQITETDIDTLLSTLEDQSREFTPKETQDIYEHWLNQIIRQYNSGSQKFEKTLFKLFQFGLENNLLYDHGKITPTLYRNIAIIASRLKEYNWALEFVDNYREKLEIRHQETAYSFNKARIFIQMKEYDKVIDILRNVEYEDITYNLNSKLAIIISYYELDEFQVLDSFLKSFKVFLRRRRNIPKSRKDAFYGFTNVLSNIMKAKERYEAKPLKTAIRELEEGTSIPNKEWLLEKIEELEKKLKISVFKL